MRIDDENAIRNRTGMKLVPGSHGMNVPSTCTIVLIAGRPQLKLP